jgi:Na+/proline symporter
MQITVIVIVVLYMIAMLGVGYFASRRIRSITDFMVAGRRIVSGSGDKTIRVWDAGD